MAPLSLALIPSLLPRQPPSNFRPHNTTITTNPPPIPSPSPSPLPSPLPSPTTASNINPPNQNPFFNPPSNSSSSHFPLYAIIVLVIFSLVVLLCVLKWGLPGMKSNTIELSPERQERIAARMGGAKASAGVIRRVDSSDEEAPPPYPGIEGGEGERRGRGVWGGSGGWNSRAAADEASAAQHARLVTDSQAASQAAMDATIMAATVDTALPHHG
ncbi:MAG: hypothetical protein M1827_003212 [Pycnora praestabilis]|nr:MAG: hypothetical protein M1827_003212 [Pycnora praestabilis]